MHKKKRNQNEPLPFQLVKIFAKNYPRVWEYCDTFYKGKGKGLPRWNDLCVLPIAATLAIMGNYPIESIDEMSVFPAECAALYAWRRYKEIFTFDGDLAEMLLEQSDDIEVPLEVLYALPYPCIWIETDTKQGFFTWFENDIRTQIMELRILAFSNEYKQPLSFVLHLKEGWTVSGGIKDAVKSIPHISSVYIEKTTKIISGLLQLILYLCAVNRDVEENAHQKVITSRSKTPSAPKDVYREIRKWDVGYRVGNAIRQYKSEKVNQLELQDQKNIDEQSYPGSNKSTSKRPHARRGHYHHYWIGSKKDGTRKMILKWTAPTFINGGTKDVIPTRHNVK